MEALGKECPVSLALWSSHLVHTHYCPRVHWRIDVVEGKFIGRNLPIGSHVPLPQEQEKLLLGKVWVHFGEGDHVEGQIPAGILGREGGRGGVRGGAKGGRRRREEEKEKRMGKMQRREYTKSREKGEGIEEENILGNEDNTILSSK